MTVGPPIPAQMKSLVYSVAEQCQQHRFAVNVDNFKTIGNWYNVPENVLPVFRVNNAKPADYYDWLDQDYHDLFRPKVISLWCETVNLPDRLEEVDWILLYGLKYKSIVECFSKLRDINPNIYVSEFRHQSRLNKIPQKIRHRVLPDVISKFFEDRLW